MPSDEAQVHEVPDLTFAELQRIVRTVERERGVDHESTLQKALLLAEETLEVLRALRLGFGIATSPGRPEADLGAELADVLFVTAAVANREGIDLGAALRRKVNQDQLRLWLGPEDH